jgi:hypothetical protein
MPVTQLSNGNTDGAQLGQSASDKVGFYGTTPIVRPVVATGATVATLITALTNLGLIQNS